MSFSMALTNHTTTKVTNRNSYQFMIDASLVYRMKGCLYGQAIGDALGLGSEFMSKDEVNKNYPNGLKNYDQIIQDSHRRR